MRALITGAGGFVARHLGVYLLARGDEVIGLVRSAPRNPPRDIDLVYADLADRAAVDAAVQSARPDAVYHLAAQSSAGESLVDPWTTLSNNVQGELNLFEALRTADLRPRVLVVGSSDEYGQLRPTDIPTHEDVPLRPTSPYAVSKVTQDMVAFQYFAQFGLPNIRVRPFSHTGPGHDRRFVVPSFAYQIARIEAGEQAPEIHVGNLDVYRDFTDVRDMARAYYLAVQHAQPGDVYNLGSGISRRIGDILEELVGQANVPVQVTVDPARLRPTDLVHQEADSSKFRALTGWVPEVPWTITLRDTLDYWRAFVRTETAVAHTAIAP